MARKATELRPLMTRIPEALRRRLEKAAERSDRSMNAEIIHRLEKSFEPQPLDVVAMLRSAVDLSEQKDKVVRLAEQVGLVLEQVLPNIHSVQISEFAPDGSIGGTAYSISPRAAAEWKLDKISGDVGIRFELDALGHMRPTGFIDREGNAVADPSKTGKSNKGDK